MQDATRTSEAWAALASSLVNGLEARSVDAQLHCSLSGTSSSETKPRGRKRVRRMQIELPFFRHQLRELELKLKRLKLQSASPVAATVKRELQSPRSVQNLVEKGPGTDRNSVWNGIAEHQLKERLRVEQQRQQLKQTHEEMVRLSGDMQKLLRKWGEQQQEVAERVGTKPQQRYRYWDCEKDKAEDIYAGQLSIVARLRLRLQSQSQQLPSRTLYVDSGLSMGPELVKWDPSINVGFKLGLHRGTVLPFRLEVVSEAYWRFFVFGYESDHVVQVVRDDESDMSTGTIVRSFKIRADFEGFTSTLGCKMTFCRYVDEDGTVTIAWASIGNVKEINGVQFHGLQLHKNGCIKLRRVPTQGRGQQSTSTVVEVSCETIPVFQDGVVDKAQQTQALLDEIDKGHAKVDKFFCQRMGTLLVETDWKATFGRETMIEESGHGNHDCVGWKVASPDEGNFS